MVIHQNGINFAKLIIADKYHNFCFGKFLMTISRIKAFCKASLSGLENDSEIIELLIDSRKVTHPAGAIFIALNGRRNGHDFIGDAYEKGVRNFLISEAIDLNKFPEACFLTVPDTLAALQLLAAQYRASLHFPVVGITGSNGKTVVKELLYQLLHDLPVYQKGSGIIRSPKSYNSQIGVPLTIWLMQPDHSLGIVEAGISQPGEMELLEKMIRPDIGIFTNIGEAHNEGFMNTRQKINEKLKLFIHTKQLIYCKDYPEIHDSMLQFSKQLSNASPEKLQLFTWSHKSDANLKILSTTTEGQQTRINALFQATDSSETARSLSIIIPYTDEAYIENAIHCWCLMLLLGIDDAIIAAKMATLQAVAMRLELRHGDNNCTIINDTYNSDLTSFKIALDFLEQQKHHKHKTLIVSDMLQVGRPDSELYEEIAAIISQHSIQRVICIGPALGRHKAFFRKYKKYRSIFFKTTEDFLKKIHLITFSQEAILLKGARTFQFENIEKILEQKIHKTILEVNLSAITHNLNLYRSMLKKGTKLMAMVKAFSYGNGNEEIANLLQFEGVDYIAVAYTDEGVSLRKAGITIPIMVMSPEPDSFDRMISWKLEPEIFNMHSLKRFTDIASTLGVMHYPIHIKLDTGMHRLGFTEYEIDDLGKILPNNMHAKVASIFSHLAGSDTVLLDDFTALQSSRFEAMSSQLTDYLGYRPIRHLSNTAGISRHKSLHFDMVRLGIGLYGIDANEKIQKRLQPISTLKTIIAQIKELPVGETVGYSRKGIINRASRIATVAIGYADGYYRSFGNGKAYMLVNGKPANVIGNVCMDMCMIDITGMEQVNEGDEVIVFGEKLPVSKLAQWADTIPYEIMTGISQRVKRVYVND